MQILKNCPLGNSPFHGSQTEANLFSVSIGRCHQVSNGFEDNVELFVVLAFEFVQTPSEFGDRSLER